MTNDATSSLVVWVQPAWSNLVRGLLDDPAWRSVLVLGPVDSGKSTLCGYLGAELASRWSTARIDCDPGQSLLGIPGTFALGAEPWRGGPPLAVWFIGATSPVGHVADVRTGAGKLMGRAGARGFERVVVDSWGYFEPASGRSLQRQLIESLRPDYVVAVQRSGELESLLTALGPAFQPRIFRVPASDRARRRSQDQRRAYRQDKYSAYFRTARSHRLSVLGLGFDGSLPGQSSLSDTLPGRLVALCDREGFVVALALVERWAAEEETLVILAPPFESGAVRSVRLADFALVQRIWEERPAIRR